jgi:hypothetical protein
LNKTDVELKATPLISFRTLTSFKVYQTLDDFEVLLEVLVLVLVLRKVDSPGYALNSIPPAGTSDILTKNSGVFPQTLQANAGVIPRLDYDHFLPNPCQFVSLLSGALWFSYLHG